MKYNRVFTIVLDSLGIGALEDANLYGDENTNTLKSICDNYDINLPNLEGLGLGSFGEYKGIYKLPANLASIAELGQLSAGKDTITGHYEMMGLVVDKPFKTFSNGFPKEFILEFEKITGYKTIGNIACSGTTILEMYGQRHLDTHELIVYTSADSVFQIAAHNDVISEEELYKICEIARKLLMKDDWLVARVIARPFKGNNIDGFIRTSGRKDYALDPFNKTVLDYLTEASIPVYSIGKIYDIFNGHGISNSIKALNNTDAMNKTIELSKENFTGFAFINLVDFDMLYGHRRDPIGYGKALEQFDNQLGDLLYNLKEDDLLIITADHGNDPTHKGTDHTREKVPCLIYSKSIIRNRNFGKLESFKYIGHTIADNFELKITDSKYSLLKYL